MYIVGVTGLSCSGKTTLSQSVQARLGVDQCLLISMDDYYKELTDEQYTILHNDAADINFDTPEMINFALLRRHLSDLKANRPFEMPKFDLGSCKVTATQHVAPHQYKYVIVEGLFVLADAELAAMCNLRIWMETCDYVCALRRFIKFTCKIKGYTHDYVYNQCVKYVIPGQDKYVKPVKKNCDLFINGEKNDVNYVEMIVKYITDA